MLPTNTFSTPRRKFILTDTPGHVQYTRNMATGASTADIAVILVDARQGITEQTRRHTAISHLLKIPSIVFAINKIDLIDFDEKRFIAIQNELRALTNQLSFQESAVLPISALEGDNIISLSKRLHGTGFNLFLKYLKPSSQREKQNNAGRLAVQYVIRPHQNFQGLQASFYDGSLKLGDQVKIFENTESRIKALYRAGRPVESVEEGQSVVVELKDEQDVQTGSIISHKNQSIDVSKSG